MASRTGTSGAGYYPSANSSTSGGHNNVTSSGGQRASRRNSGVFDSGSHQPQQQHQQPASGPQAPVEYDPREYEQLAHKDPAELAQRLQREKADRLYVERLFAVREEHHSRSKLNQQEIHERELLSTAGTFAHTLRAEAERHRAEMDALRATLEQRSGIGGLQRSVQSGLRSLTMEQDALQQLATAAEAHEAQFKNATAGEKLAWDGEKAQLLRRIGDLELAVQASRATGSNPTDPSSMSIADANALAAKKAADEAWARAKNQRDGLMSTPAAAAAVSTGGSSLYIPGQSPPPEFRLTPLPASVVSLDAVEKARRRTTQLLEQLAPTAEPNRGDF